MSNIRSHIDVNKIAHPEQWVLSLVAKKRGSNPEHAFILLEGLDRTGHNVIFRRYDFVIGDKNTSAIPIKKGSGLVITKEYTLEMANNDADTQARTFWAEMVNDIDKEEGCYGASWVISDEHAQQLHKEVLKDQTSPPDYQLSGEHGIFAKSSSQSGHNCYTWAKAKISHIDDQNIKHDARLTPQILDFIASRTSRHIVPPRTNDRTNSSCLIL